MAANMGALAESFGLRQGSNTASQSRTSCKLCCASTPRFSRDPRIARWDAGTSRCRSIFGGSHKHAEQHLRASLRYNDNSTASHFFLAELLIDENRTADARLELQKVLDAPFDPQWTPEDREYKDKAQKLLASLK